MDLAEVMMISTVLKHVIKTEPKDPLFNANLVRRNMLGSKKKREGCCTE